MNFCVDCGSRLHEGKQFCWNCGASTASTGEETATRLVTDTKCSKCGDAIEENSKFCTSCGSGTSSTLAHSTAPAQLSKHTAISPKKKRVIMAACGVLVLVAVVGGVLFIMSPGNLIVGEWVSDEAVNVTSYHFYIFNRNGTGYHATTSSQQNPTYRLGTKLPFRWEIKDGLLYINYIGYGGSIISSNGRTFSVNRNSLAMPHYQLQMTFTPRGLEFELVNTGQEVVFTRR